MYSEMKVVEDLVSLTLSLSLSLPPLVSLTWSALTEGGDDRLWAELRDVDDPHNELSSSKLFVRELSQRFPGK